MSRIVEVLLASRYAEVEIDSLSTDDLIEELELRDWKVSKYPEENVQELAEKVYWQIRDGAEVTPEMRTLVAQLADKIL
jgi:hypothetical protein